MGSRSSARLPHEPSHGLQCAAGRSANVRSGVPGSLVGDLRRSLWRLRGSTGNVGTRGPGRQVGAWPSRLVAAELGIVIGIIALVTPKYWRLVRAFPEGGGPPDGAGRAFGEEWSFLPIGALVVDFALTIAISIAARGTRKTLRRPDASSPPNAPAGLRSRL